MTDKIASILAEIRDLNVPHFLQLAELLNVSPHHLVSVAYKDTVNLAVVCRNGKVIQAIKQIRDCVPGMGLKEAKDLVDESRAIIPARRATFLRDIPLETAKDMVASAFANDVEFVIQYTV